MPELPEVETTLRGVAPYLENQPVTAVTVRIPKLRTPIPPNLPARLVGTTLTNLRRRNKFILADTSGGETLLLHLGMSGRLALTETATPLGKHDHVVLRTALLDQTGTDMRFNDARRFGLFELIPTLALPTHPFLRHLGPEPFSPDFTPATLYASLQKIKQPVKVALMDNRRTVVGVGNIYASESLFRSNIHPATPANLISKKQAETLHQNILATLSDAIAAGGSSLRDFQHADGKLGYFQSTFNVYGRTGQPCRICATPIQNAVFAQRNTFWCATCQPLVTAKKQRRA